MVLIAPPPPINCTPRPQYKTVTPLTPLVRIFNPASRHKTQADTYRYFGPLLRFDHHQPLTKEEATRLKGKKDPSRGIAYWGFTLSCCLVELFGDSKIVEFKDYEVAIATIKQPLLLLDIRESGAMAAGSVAALGSVADRSISQAWSRYFYEKTEIYQEVHGILYNNAHNGEKAIALYERSSLIIRSANIQTRLLRDKSIRHLIDACVADNNMNCFEPYSSDGETTFII
jgi:hypothetical protein